jgi:hypothetical protein
MDDVSTIRLRLAEIVQRAETNEVFHKRLKEDPSAVLAEYDIPKRAVEDFSSVFGAERARAGVAEDEGDCMLFTKGCNDFTCFSSHCPETCFVTIVIHAPDS